MKFTLNYSIRHREPQSGVAIQSLWIASSLTLLATTGYYAKPSSKEGELAHNGQRFLF